MKNLARTFSWKLMCSLALLALNWALNVAAVSANELNTRPLEPIQTKISIGPGKDAFSDIERLGYMRGNEIVAVKHTNHSKILKDGAIVNATEFVDFTIVVKGEDVVSLTESGEIRSVTSRWPLLIGTGVARESKGTEIWVYIHEIGYFEYFEFTKNGIVSILDGDTHQNLKASHARIWSKNNPGN